MKKYFKYEFRKSLPLIGVLSAIAVALCLVQFITIKSETAGMTSMAIIIYLAGTLALWLPFSIFNYKMKKRSIDLFYALPLSHKKIITVKFLVGLTVLFIPYAVSYSLSFLIMLSMAHWVNPAYYVSMFFAAIIPLYLIYAISSFLFTRANKLFDGLVFTFLWLSAITLVLSVISRFLPSQTAGMEDAAIDYFVFGNGYLIPFFYHPFAPLYLVIFLFTMMASGQPISMTPVVLTNLCVGGAVVLGCGIAATVGIILLEKKAKAEHCEQISQSPFGYKTLIPLYCVCLVSTCMQAKMVELIFLILIFIMAFAASAIYKRTVKIGWKQLIIILGSMLAGIVLYYLGSI